MPKQKTHKGLKKRVRLTASGKLNRKRAGAAKLMSGKSGRRRRRIRRAALVSATQLKLMRAKLGV